jgi:hypothetical protein
MTWRISALAVAVAALALMPAAPASAARCGHPRGGDDYVTMRIVQIHARRLCPNGYRVVRALEGRRNALFRMGRHRYVVPVTGDDRGPGRVWRCTVTVRARYEPEYQHEVLRAHGFCIYKSVGRSRFRMKSGWYA